MNGFIKKGAALGVLMSLMLASAPVSADVYYSPNTDFGDGGAGLLVLIITTVGVTTTLGSQRSSYDSSKAISLIDQAYEGSGDKLEVLAQGSKKTVEDVSDAIVALDKAGKLDIAKPEEMAAQIANAITNSSR